MPALRGIFMSSTSTSYAASREPFQRLLAVVDALGLVALARELAHDQLAQVPLVVGDEHAHVAAGAAHAGSTTRKTAPSPGFVVTSIRPPWSATMPWAIASPRPGALPRRLRGEERIEDPRQHVVGNARALVHELDHDLVPARGACGP